MKGRRWWNNIFKVFEPKILYTIYACVLSWFGYICSLWFFATLWTGARQAPLSMGFSRQGYWSGWPGPPLCKVKIFFESENWLDPFSNYNWRPLSPGDLKKRKRESKSEGERPERKPLPHAFPRALSRTGHRVTCCSRTSCQEALTIHRAWGQWSHPHKKEGNAT